MIFVYRRFKHYSFYQILRCFFAYTLAMFVFSSPLLILVIILAHFVDWPKIAILVKICFY